MKTIKNKVIHFIGGKAPKYSSKTSKWLIDDSSEDLNVLEYRRREVEILNMLSIKDGNTWTYFTPPNNGTWMNLSVSRNRFWATQTSGTSNAASSVDGTTWTARTKPTTGYWRGGYGSDTMFMICEDSNSTGYYSTDGISWTSTTFPSAASWNFVQFNGTYWVVISDGTAVATSTNGITWTARTKTNGLVGSIGHSRSTGRVVAVGYNNELAYILEGK